MSDTKNLWNKVKEEVNTMSIEPIREWLDVKENRRDYRGSTGKDGIGDYYCIPVDVLHKCGMSIEEIFQGKTAIEEQEWRRKHMCIQCGEIASTLDHDEWCDICKSNAEEDYRLDN
tara:strand:- start:154 stop:501 length:348 start_codon:yes stop_codon:yes gene_type:complete